MKDSFLMLLMWATSFFVGYAQPSAKVRLLFPDGLNVQQVQLTFDNGASKSNITLTAKDQDYTLEKKLEAVYGILEIKWKEGADDQLLSHRFLIEADKSAVIKMLPNTSEGLSFKTKHVIDLEENGGHAFNEYMAPHLKDLQLFFKENSEKMNAGDKATATAFDKKLSILNEKRLAFILTHPKQYHSFLIFKDFLLSSKMDGERLKEIYQKTFSQKIKESTQGQSVARYLDGKSLKAGDESPEFMATDINGNKIQSTDYVGKKHVLVFFWATWCRFCMAEIPEIKAIREAYSEKDLTIIAVSRDFDPKAHKAGIEKHNMNWTHLYAQPQLANLFAISEVPSFLLIDEQGVIRMKEQGLQLERFEEVKAILKAEI